MRIHDDTLCPVDISSYDICRLAADARKTCQIIYIRRNLSVIICKQHLRTRFDVLRFVMIKSRLPNISL